MKINEILLRENKEILKLCIKFDRTINHLVTQNNLDRSNMTVDLLELKLFA